MADTGTGLVDGKETVATAGTRVRMTGLTTTSGSAITTTSARSVVIQALSTNLGVIVIGGSTVVAAAGTHAAPTRRGVALEKNESVAFDIDDLGSIWLDATESGDGVSWVAMIA